MRTLTLTLTPSPTASLPIAFLRRPSATDRKFCLALRRAALRSLHAELVLYPKPGLVSPIDTGSHDDMNAVTFMRSLFSLRRYFSDVTQAGIDAMPFSHLRGLGIEAEARMLTATQGVNTHRGAIFCLGLLCAVTGACRAQGASLTAENIQAMLVKRWGDDLSTHTQTGAGNSHGLKVAAMHAVGGAREEAAQGFPSVFNIALPALRSTLAAGRSLEEARIDALFSLMAHINDTNVYYRGGVAGANIVKCEALRFLALGGTAQANWHCNATRIHKRFVELRLSPGGAADLLAATCLLHEVILEFQY